jgi:HD-like signal output (HDOD) protein
MGLFSFWKRKPLQIPDDAPDEPIDDGTPVTSVTDAFPPPGPPLPAQPDAPDERFAEAMNVDPALLAASAPPLDPEEREIAGALLEHFDAHRPGPASFPGLAMKVLELVRDQDVQVARLAATVENDPALSAALLVLSNSVLYRGIDEVRTVRDAIARLGLSEVARLASALATRSLYQSGVRAEFEAFAPAWNRLFFHAAATARGASELAKARRIGNAESVFLGGMLHDVGKSLALRSLAALSLEGKVKVRDEDSLERILHRVHVEVGGEAHREWGLPRGLAELAVLHHDAAIPAGPQHAELHLVRLVSALLLHRERPGLHPDAPGEALQSARALGLGPDRVAALGVALGETQEWVTMMFGDGGGPSTAPGNP